MQLVGWKKWHLACKNLYWTLNWHVCVCVCWFFTEKKSVTKLYWHFYAPCNVTYLVKL